MFMLQAQIQLLLTICYEVKVIMKERYLIELLNQYRTRQEQFQYQGVEIIYLTFQAYTLYNSH